MTISSLKDDGTIAGGGTGDPNETSVHGNAVDWMEVRQTAFLAGSVEPEEAGVQVGGEGYPRHIWHKQDG